MKLKNLQSELICITVGLNTPVCGLILQFPISFELKILTIFLMGQTSVFLFMGLISILKKMIKRKIKQNKKLKARKYNKGVRL